MTLFSKNRCKICKEERVVRECPRNGKKIGWRCCNGLRYDMKCPSSCEYYFPPSESLAYNIKADSLAEANDLVMRLFDVWSMKIHPEIGTTSPMELASTEEGKKALEKYFSNIQILNTLPINKMRAKLKLKPIELPTINNFEEFAQTIMDIHIEQDWEAYIQHYFHPEQLLIPENKAKLIKRNQKIKLFKKIKSYSLISSSLNKESKEALVHFDVNKGAEMTLNVIQVGDIWKIKSRIIGDPQLFYGEDTAIKHIASLLNKNELDEVFDLCNRFANLYPDSSDIEYYWGLYHSLSGNVNEARKHFEISYILDPTFVEPLYNLGFIKQVEKDNEGAKDIYHQVLEINPKEVKTLNNLAILHIYNKEWDEALGYLEKCIEYNPEYDIAQMNYDIVKKQLKEQDK